MDKLCGIYCIKNEKNGKRYIGQSVDIEKRFYDHKRNLDKKDLVQENNHFINAWHLYGPESFSFNILEECDKNQLNDRERYWIKYYNTTNEKYGYNMTSGGTGGNTIANYTEDELINYKHRKSEQCKEIMPKAENAPRSKLTNNDVLNILLRFQSGDYDTSIAKDYNVSLSTIQDIRKRRTWTSITNKYEWPDVNGRKITQKNYVAIDMYTKSGEYIRTYANARIANIELGIGYKLISAVCHGSKCSAGGYVWRLHGHPFNEFEPKFDNCVSVNQYDLDGNFLKTYKSIKEAENEAGTRIYSCLVGRTKTAGGYRWQYAK